MTTEPRPAFNFELPPPDPRRAWTDVALLDGLLCWADGAYQFRRDPHAWHVPMEPAVVEEVLASCGWNEPGFDKSLARLSKVLASLLQLSIVSTQDQAYSIVYSTEQLPMKLRLRTACPQALERWRAPAIDEDSLVLFANQWNDFDVRFVRVELDLKELLVEVEDIGAGWYVEQAPSRGLPYGPATEARDLWTAQSEDESAAVAGFARLSLELLQAGAPRSLVEGAHRSALDEVGHARMSENLAAAEEVPQRALPIEGARGGGPVALAVRAFAESCVQEGIAARLAAEGAERTGGLEHLVLSRIAREEADHAELGWSIIEWALAQEPERVPLALARARPPRGFAEAPGLDDDAAKDAASNAWTHDIRPRWLELLPP